MNKNILSKTKSFILFLFVLVLLTLNISAQTNVDWVRPRNERVPEDAIPAGNQADAKITYICRVNYRGSTISGKLVENTCYFHWERGERSSRNYDVLVGEDYFWKKSGVDYERAVIGGGDDSENYYICRVDSDGGKYPGFVRGSRCFYTKNGRGYSSRSFEVLQTRDYANTLLTAAGNGNVRALREALRGGQAINQTNRSGQTALMLASEKGYSAIIRELLYERASVDLRDNNGNTALMRAAGNGHEDVVRLLIREGANVKTANDAGETAFLLAASNGHSRIISDFLREEGFGGVSLFEMEQAFRAAAYRGHTNVLDVLLYERVDIESRDSDGRTALMLGASNGRSDTVAYLLQKGADINAFDIRENTAFNYAVSADSDKVMRVLAETGNLKKDDGQVLRSLFTASLQDKRDAMKFLIGFGVDVNTQDISNGNTVLMLAAGEGHEKMTEMLIESGANLNMQNDQGETAAMIAAAKSKNNTLKRLVKAGADLNLRDDQGRTALGLAILNKHKDTRKTLQKAGARQ